MIGPRPRVPSDDMQTFGKSNPTEGATMSNALHCLIVVSILFGVIAIWTGILVFIADHS